MSLRIMAAAVAVSAVATGAQAVTLDILSVTGKWINPTQVQADFEQPADNMIRWGDPATDRGKSGQRDSQSFDSFQKVTEHFISISCNVQVKPTNHCCVRQWLGDCYGFLRLCNE